MRPTTRDLAKAAGVSLATVDRVLNARTGVRQKTVDQVHKAVEQLGFERNVVAAALARRRALRFLFVLPEAQGQFVAQLLLRIREMGRAVGSEMVEADVRKVDASDPHRIAALLADVDASAWDGVAIMAPETPQVRDAMNRMEDRGIHTVALISQQPGAERAAFVGIDNVAAGATAGELLRRFVSSETGTVLVIGDSLQSRDSVERRLGFDRVLAETGSRLLVLPSVETRGDPDRARAVVAAAAGTRSDLVAIYVFSSEARPALAAIADALPGRPLVRIAHERTPFTETALREGRVDALVTQDQGHLVRSAIRVLRARCEGREALASQERIRIEILMKHNL